MAINKVYKNSIMKSAHLQLTACQTNLSRIQRRIHEYEKIFNLPLWLRSIKIATDVTFDLPGNFQIKSKSNTHASSETLLDWSAVVDSSQMQAVLVRSSLMAAKQLDFKQASMEDGVH